MIKKTRHGGTGTVVPDMDLWEKVAQNVRPLRAGPVTSSGHAARPPAKQPLPSAHPAARPQTQVRGAEPPLLTGLDRRTAQRLLRGQVQYDSKLDLHGVRVSDARVRLAGFLLAFTFSLDNVITSVFVQRPGSSTLPLYILSSFRAGLKGDVAAIAVLTFLASVFAIVIAAWLLSKGAKQGRFMGGALN